MQIIQARSRIPALCSDFFKNSPEKIVDFSKNFDKIINEAGEFLLLEGLVELWLYFYIDW